MGVLIDRTGEIHNNIKIIEELGGNKVKGLCIKCGHIGRYTKQYCLNGNPTCKGCGLHRGIISKVGQTFNNLRVIKELGLQQLRCECITCGVIDDYCKSKVSKEKQSCKHCYSIYSKCKSKQEDNQVSI